MDAQAVTSSDRWAGDGARIIGRAVIAGGIAMGLMFGLGWWLLADRLTGRGPANELALPRSGQPAQALPLPLPSSAAASPDVPAPPLPSPSPSTAPPPAPAPASGAPTWTTPPGRSILPVRPVVVLTAQYVTTSAWDTGYIGKITVNNVSGDLQYYDVRVQLPAGVSVTDAWSNTATSSSVSNSGGAVTFRGGPVNPRGSVVVGFQARKDPALTRPRQFEPTSCTVNGNACG